MAPLRKALVSGMPLPAALGSTKMMMAAEVRQSTPAKKTTQAHVTGTHEWPSDADRDSISPPLNTRQINAR
jgi:hypothetical protein